MPTHEAMLCIMLRGKFRTSRAIRNASDKELIAAYTCWAITAEADDWKALPALLDEQARKRAYAENAKLVI